MVVTVYGALKTNYYMYKRKIVFYFVLILFSVAANCQTIKLYEKGAVNYNTELPVDTTILVLSQNNFTLKLVVSEIDVDDFVTEDRQLTLEITNTDFPTDAAPVYTNESETADITGFGTAPTLNGNEITNTITIGGTTTSDEFSIAEIPVNIPETISAQTDYQLILHHDLAGTAESVTLITFRYIKPQLTINRDGGAGCPAHEVATTLSISPNDKDFDLYINAVEWTEVVSDGYEIDLPKDAEVYIKDPNNSDDFGHSDITKIAGLDFFEDITLSLINTETEICARQALEFEVSFGNCANEPDALAVLFLADGETDYDTISIKEYDFGASPAFSFAPNATGDIRLLATYGTGADTAMAMSNAVSTPTILFFDEYNFQNNIRVSQMAGEFEMLKKLTSSATARIFRVGFNIQYI